jgi:hypothetical protein
MPSSKTDRLNKLRGISFTFLAYDETEEMAQKFTPEKMAQRLTSEVVNRSFDNLVANNSFEYLKTEK